MENGVFEAGGIAFLYATLWTGMDGRDPDTLRRVERGVSDFLLIASGTKRFTALDAADLHEATVAWLRCELAARPGQPVVVVTHHAPSPRGLNPAFTNSSINAGFASDLEDIARTHANIHSWIFGHTHVRTTFRIAGTTFRANCVGYPGTDLLSFDPETSFEIS